jgi:hypothetical protein
MPGIKFALGENPKRAGNPQGGRGAPTITTARYPATRMGVEDTIREAFNEAKAYKASWDAYQAKTKAGEKAIAPRRDLKLERLKEVLEGKRLVHVHCYRADEILMMLRVADDYGFKVRDPAARARRIQSRQGDCRARRRCFHLQRLVGTRPRAFDAIPYNAAIMQEVWW